MQLAGSPPPNADLVTMLWYWKGQARDIALSAGMAAVTASEETVYTRYSPDSGAANTATPHVAI